MERKAKAYGLYEVTVVETSVKKVLVAANGASAAVYKGLQLAKQGVFQSYEKPTDYACKKVRLIKEGFE